MLCFGLQVKAAMRMVPRSLEPYVARLAQPGHSAPLGSTVSMKENIKQEVLDFQISRAQGMPR